MSDSAETQHKGNSPSPKRRKLSTINYIQKTFFVEGHESDIKIIALNREWNLHKSFLSQSPYFKSMFSSSWVTQRKRKTLKEINLEIVDVNITSEALHKVFESLYSDEIQIEPTEVVPILACASFFLLNELIEHCATVMKDCIKGTATAVRFFEVAELYSIEEVKNKAFEWLCRNLLLITKPPQQLNMITEDLMKKLLISPDLCVIDETHAIFILTAWIFLKENDVDFACKSVSDLVKHPRFFQYFATKEKPFLETDSGMSYQSFFHALRLKDSLLEFERIEKLNIIPMEWMMPLFKTQWYHMSRIHRGKDNGPKSVSEDIFNKECVRITMPIKHNRKVLRNDYFDFGFGFAFIYDNGRFKIKRNLSSEINSNSSKDPASSDRNERYLMYRVSAFMMDSDGRVLSEAETGIKTVSMAPNKEIEVLTVTCNPFIGRIRNFICRINLLFITP